MMVHTTAPLDKYPWLTKVYELTVQDKIHDAIDVFFERFDDLGLSDIFIVCPDYLEKSKADLQQVLTILDLDLLKKDLIVAFLILSLKIKDTQERKQFLERSIEWFENNLPKDRIESILQGLI